MVAVAGSGGWSDRIRPTLIDDAWLDERRVTALTFAETAADAVAQAVARIAEPRRQGGLQAHLGAAGH